MIAHKCTNNLCQKKKFILNMIKDENQCSQKRNDCLNRVPRDYRLKMQKNSFSKSQIDLQELVEREILTRIRVHFFLQVWSLAHRADFRARRPWFGGFTLQASGYSSSYDLARRLFHNKFFIFYSFSSRLATKFLFFMVSSSFITSNANSKD